MTDIEAKALALVNEIEREEGEKELTRRIMRGLIMDEALCRAIEQHEAYKQKVSDALKIARYAIRGLLDIASEENLDSEQAGRAFAALHEIGTALAALDQSK
jgi:hypothetical protein